MKRNRMRNYSKYEEKQKEELQHYDISLLGRQGSAAKDDEEDWNGFAPRRCWAVN